MPQRLPAPKIRDCRSPLRRLRPVVVASTLATAAALTVLPTSGLPTSGLPTSGLPTSGLPTSGLPTSGLPTSGLPTSGATAPAPAPAAVERAVVPAAHAVTSPAARQEGARGAVRSSALQNALGKIGAPYRWGATGPNAFDCSGLVNWAFQQEGVDLPRSSRALASAGTPVSRSALRPGDLVLFYQPVSHVGIYVGNGKVVHASTSGCPVKISDMNRMPFNSARRV